MQKFFVYLNWKTSGANPSLRFYDDQYSTVEVTTSTGPYKNLYADITIQKGEKYYWQIKIIRGTNFKIGIFKESQIANFKGKAFSDDVNGYAFYSSGHLRNGSNKTGTAFLKAYGPGDVIGVLFDTKKGQLSFRKNKEQFKIAQTNQKFKNGGYVPAVAALLQESKFSFTLPPLQD